MKPRILYFFANIVPFLKQYIISTNSKIKNFIASPKEEKKLMLLQFSRRMRILFKNMVAGKRLPFVLGLFTLSLTYLTYRYLSGSFSTDEYNNRMVIALIVTNLTMVVGLAALIISRLYRLWQQGKQSGVGSSLQMRMVMIFSGLTIIPTIIMTSFSLYFIIFGVQNWFDSKISSALQNSVLVADAYLNEHKVNLKADAIAVATDIQKNAKKLQKDKDYFKQFLNGQISIRSLSKAAIMSGKEMQQGAILKDDPIFKNTTNEILKKANRGEVVMILQDTSPSETSNQKDLAQAFIKLKNFDDTYLMISRKVDAKVVSYVRNAGDSFAQYEGLRKQTKTLQLNFSFIFVGVSVILLLIAMWFGIFYSGKLIQPINRLVTATEKVKYGDLTVRVEQPKTSDELSALVSAFNSMANNLELNQGQLSEAGRQVDERRRLIEAVFSGVTSGVISLDKDRKVKLYNKSAAYVLNVTDERFIGFSIREFFPEIAGIFEEVNKFPERIFQQELEIKREAHRLNLLVRVVAEQFMGVIDGYIISIDDVTRLVTAQRNAAWSDVARRIAHEIKNPLTPIHLSAERIRSKFAKEVSDVDSLNKYIDNISRHAENIGKIVKEFSDFARMPEPVLKQNSLKEVIRDAIFSEKLVHPEITYLNELPDGNVHFDFDRELISQVLQNMLKNAAESINENQQPRDKKEIFIKVTTDKSVQLEISDSGKGFPPELINRLTEPYVTTRERGTGLGLAIVKKVLDDHNASIDFSNILDANNNIVGARIKINFYI